MVGDSIDSDQFINDNYRNYPYGYFCLYFLMQKRPNQDQSWSPKLFVEKIDFLKKSEKKLNADRQRSRVKPTIEIRSDEMQNKYKTGMKLKEFLEKTHPLSNAEKGRLRTQFEV